MAYRSNYRRGYSRRPTIGRISKVNARPGDCRTCGETIPACAGQLWREHDGSWSVIHTESSQGGWLMDPRPVTGGCPVDTDARNRELHASGFFGKDAPAPRSERDRIASTAAAYANRTERERSERDKYSYASTHARYARRGRCEDAPCCGCCD